MRSLPTLLARGASAAVYDLGDGTVLKAGIRSLAPIGNAADHDFLVRAFFLFERKAYERVGADPDLSLFTPRYYGPSDEGWRQLVPPPGKLLVEGTGFRIEKLAGAEEKVGCLPPDLLEIADNVLIRIKEVMGLADPFDASAFFPGSRAAVTVIDFAHWEQIDASFVSLNREGTLSAGQRDFVLRLLDAA